MSAVKRSRPRRRGKASRLDLTRHSFEGIRAADRRRLLCTCGAALIGWWPAATPIADALADVERWHADPACLDNPGAGALSPAWLWGPGDQLALWHAGRLVALVALAGNPPEPEAVMIENLFD